MLDVKGQFLVKHALFLVKSGHIDVIQVYCLNQDHKFDFND